LQQLPPFQYKKAAINDKFSFAEARAMEKCGKKCTG
jgi:hypothetical protein